MSNLESNKIENIRRDVEELDATWYVLVPALIWILSTILLIVLKLLIDNFVSWWWVFFYSFIILLIPSLSSLIVYYIKKPSVSVSDNIKYLKPDEATEYIIKFWMKEKYNPVNLELHAGSRKISTTKTVGSGSQERTEVYVRKFIDANPLCNDIYYCFMRVNQPDTLSTLTYKNELSEDEEKAVIDKLAEELALTPRDFRETTINRNSPITGVEEIITTREPLGTNVPEASPKTEKEDLE